MNWFVLVWPAILGMALWYWGYQRNRLKKKNRTCPSCNRECQALLSMDVMTGQTDVLTGQERMEMGLKTAYVRIYRCYTCGKHVKARIPLEKDGYECCPGCKNISFHKEEKFKTVKAATTSSEGLMEARHKCLCCGAEYVVGYRIPQIRTSSGGAGGSGRSGEAASVVVLPVEEVLQAVSDKKDYLKEKNVIS